MSQGGLQDLLDRVAITSWQRWLLIAITVLSAAAASTVCAVVEGHQTVGVLVLIVVLATAASLRPDDHVALVVEALIVWQWIAAADEVTTPWSIALAACLFVFHATVAMMAVTPITAVVGPDVSRTWLARGGLVMLATVGMWAIVVVVDQGDRAGSALLTAAGFVTLAGLVLVARWRLAPVEQDGDH